MTATVRVLFVCSGNTCRSPFAEYFARQGWTGHDVTVSSAGSSASPGQHATPNMVLIGDEYGLDLTGHVTRSLDQCATPDLVFGMEPHHLESARLAFPDLAPERFFLLDEAGIDDPYGHGPEEYRRSAGSIAAAIEAVDVEGFLRCVER